MGRYDTKHSYEDVGIPLLFPVLLKKTVVTDTKTGKSGKGLDWKSYRESERKARKDLTKE